MNIEKINGLYKSRNELLYVKKNLLEQLKEIENDIKQVEEEIIKEKKRDTLPVTNTVPIDFIKGQLEFNLYSKEYYDKLSKELREDFSISRKDRELIFAKRIGFEIGSYVQNLEGKKFYVKSIRDLGGILSIEHISILLVEDNNNKEGKEIRIYDRNSVKRVPYYGISREQFMDEYLAAD